MVSDFEFQILDINTWNNLDDKYVFVYPLDFAEISLIESLGDAHILALLEISLVFCFPVEQLRIVLQLKLNNLFVAEIHIVEAVQGLPDVSFIHSFDQNAPWIFLFHREGRDDGHLIRCFGEMPSLVQDAEDHFVFMVWTHIHPK